MVLPLRWFNMVPPGLMLSKSCFAPAAPSPGLLPNEVFSQAHVPGILQESSGSEVDLKSNENAFSSGFWGERARNITTYIATITT